MPNANIACNYEGIWGMAPMSSAQKNSESYEPQTIAKSSFVLLADLIPECFAWLSQSVFRLSTKKILCFGSSIIQLYKTLNMNVKS